MHSAWLPVFSRVLTRLSREGGEAVADVIEDAVLRSERHDE